MEQQKATPTYAYAHNLEFKWPYGDVQIDYLEITSGLNMHGRFLLRGFLDPDKAQHCMERINYDDCLEVNLVGSDVEAMPLFKGKTYDAHFSVKAGMTYATVQGVSHTFDMDIKKQKRSWQNKKMTFQTVLETFMDKDHPGCYFIDTISQGRQIKKIFIQFDETNYAFAIRLASYLGGVVVPDIASDKAQFTFGMPNAVREIIVEDADDLKRIYLQVGDLVTIGNVTRVVCMSKIIFDRGIVGSPISLPSKRRWERHRFPTLL